jgi:hypothetical protein
LLIKGGAPLLRFLTAVFTSGTINAALNILVVIGVLIALFIVPGSDMLLRILCCIVVVLSYFMILFGVKAFQFYQSFEKHIPVKRQLQAVGLSREGNIVVIENPCYLRDGVLLTLYSDASGTDQPLAILQVTKSILHEDVHASAFPLGTSLDDLSQYFDANNKTTLYVSPLVHVLDIQRTLYIIKRQQQSLVPNESNEMEQLQTDTLFTKIVNEPNSEEA